MCQRFFRPGQSKTQTRIRARIFHPILPVRNLSCSVEDANLVCTMSQARLRSSFIYLANAVNDLLSNWASLALVLAPLVLAAALCLLPDALNLQYELARRFEPGTHSVVWIPVQVPYRPAAAPATPPFPGWILLSLHILFALITLVVNLVVLCALKRRHTGVCKPSALGESIDVYRDAVGLLPSFLWVISLQFLVTLVGFILLIVPGLLAIIWLYFSQYALVLDNQRSWTALFRSRDLMRKRFFKVAVRILVFFAVWSGYNSWAGGTFVLASLMLGPIGAITGLLWVIIFLLDLLAVAVAYATTAFFIAAGFRLYQDLVAIAAEREAAAVEPVLPPTAPLDSLAG